MTNGYHKCVTNMIMWLRVGSRSSEVAKSMRVVAHCNTAIHFFTLARAESREAGLCFGILGVVSAFWPQP